MLLKCKGIEDVYNSFIAGKENKEIKEQTFIRTTIFIQSHFDNNLPY